MMDKLAKAQKNWLSKLILILTALSFMSLFGVSGYITGASRNKPVIKVDDIKISQQQFGMLFEQEQQMARSLFGDALQINDEIRNAMLQGLVQRELTNAIIERTAEKLNISISDNLVRKIIYSQAEFLDANGNFSLERLRRVLSASGQQKSHCRNKKQVLHIHHEVLSVYSAKITRSSKKTVKKVLKRTYS